MILAAGWAPAPAESLWMRLFGDAYVDGVTFAAGLIIVVSVGAVGTLISFLWGLASAFATKWLLRV